VKMVTSDHVEAKLRHLHGPTEDRTKVFSGWSTARADNRNRKLRQPRPQRYRGTRSVGNNLKTSNGRANFLSIRTVPNGTLPVICEYLYNLLRLCLKSRLYVQYDNGAGNFE